MKTLTIQLQGNIDLDIQWLHGWLYKALNPPGVDGYLVEIKDSKTINIEKEKTFSDITIEGEMYRHLQTLAQAQGLTVAQMIEGLEDE